MDIQSVSTEQAPKAIGPYAQAVTFGDLVFCSGQIPLDPKTGEIIVGGIEPQSRRVLENLQAVLEAAGSGLDRVLKTTVFLANLDDFGAMNAVYAEFFGEHRPARSTVQAARLPRGALLEIDAIATR